MLGSKNIQHIILTLLLIGGGGEALAQFPANIGTLPPGKSITICYEVTVDGDTPQNTTEVCEQDTVTHIDPNADISQGNQYLGFVSDDPDDATSSEDETCTPVQVCEITAITAGNRACEDGSTTYSQEVTVTFVGGAGQLDVNGQLFAIGTSPQTVTLTNLPIDGAAVNVTASFTEAIGCSKTENGLFTAPSLLTVDAGNDQSICQNETADLLAVANGGTPTYDYLWSPGGETTAGITVDPNETTVYTVTVTDDLGCEASDDVEVEVRKFSIDITGIPDLICEDTPPFTITASPEGGTWSGPGIDDPAKGKFKVHKAGVGVHQVTYEVTDPQTQCTKTKTIEIVVNQCQLKCVLYPYEKDEFSVWVQNVPGIEDDNYFFMGNKNQGGIGFLHKKDDGTAKITGTLVNRSDPNIKWMVDIRFTACYDWETWKTLGGRYKVNNQVMSPEELALAHKEHVNWTYYMMDEEHSKLIGLSGPVDGVELQIVERSDKHRFQQGWAANDKDGDYGLSGWFVWKGKFKGRMHSGYGDINADIDCREKPENDFPHNIIQDVTISSEEVLAPFGAAIGIETGSNFSMSMGLSDREGAVTYSIEGLPDNVQVDETISGDNISLNLDWEVGESDGGVYNVSVFTIDEDGKVNEREMRIEVADKGAYPAELVYFDAILLPDHSVEVVWETSSELEGTRFLLEKSRKNDVFTQYDAVDGLGNIKRGKRYKEPDLAIVKNRRFYRLKQITPNGETKYSEVVMVSVKEDASPELRVFPNPTAKNLEVRVPAVEAGEYELRMLDIRGREVFRQSYNMPAGLNSLKLDLSQIAEGVYMLFAKGQGYQGMARFSKK